MVKMVKKPARFKLQKVLRDLKSTRATVGYFADQGLHHSGMNYPSLMYLHEVKGIRSRDGKVFRRAFEVTMMAHQKKLLDGLQSRLRHKINTLGNTDSAVEAFCKETQKRIQDTFGDTSMLPGNAPATVKKKGFNAPLIETSELQRHVTYRIRKKAR